MGEDVVLSVSDRGVGFDPYAVRAGTSLGLQSIEERVHLLNGRLSVRSKTGEGTHIEAHVPLRPNTPSTFYGSSVLSDVPLRPPARTTRSTPHTH